MIRRPGNRIEGASGCPSWCRPLRPLFHFLDDVSYPQSVQGGQQIHFVDLIFQSFYVARLLCHFCPFFSCPSRIRQAVEQPNDSEQNLISDDHGHPVLLSIIFLLSLAYLSISSWVGGMTLSMVESHHMSPMTASTTSFTKYLE